MLSCVKYQKRLSAYLDEELSKREQVSVERHLEECASCRAALYGLKALESLLFTPDVPPVPSGLTARVMAAARNRQREATTADWNLLKWWRMTSAPVHAAAVWVLVVGLTVGLVLGWTSAPQIVQITTAVQPDPLDMYQLDYLGDLPAGSLADSYLTLVVATKEGGR